MENIEPNEKDMKISPTEWGYKDRNMAKWQGFILSDHADLVNAQKKQPLSYAAKEKQTLSAISTFLHRSFAYGGRLSIQLDFMVNGSYEPDIIGVVTGFEHEKIYIQTDEELVVIDLSLIRHIESLLSAKWFISDPT